MSNYNYRPLSRHDTQLKDLYIVYELFERPFTKKLNQSYELHKMLQILQILLIIFLNDTTLISKYPKVHLKDYKITKNFCWH